MSWSVAQGLLAPLREAPSVGKNISERQPDVEVLAMLMNDAPTNSVAFDSLRRTNEWLSVGFAVVAVGPPGFSSVPYTSGKKDKDEATLPLYSTTEDGKTMFSTFEKVKNNKDRGKRMQEMECEEVVKSATAVLQPGLILSTFVREDTFGSVGAFFVADTQDTPDVLPAGSFVWLQLGVKNNEQAAKGQLQMSGESLVRTQMDSARDAKAGSFQMPKWTRGMIVTPVPKDQAVRAFKYILGPGLVVAGLVPTFAPQV